jgi:nitrogenase molybdenum-iron protein alpha/beta subunit
VLLKSLIEKLPEISEESGQDTSNTDFIKQSIAELYEKLKEEYDDDEITMNDIADELAEYGLNATFRELCILFGDIGLSLDGKLDTDEYKQEVGSDSQLGENGLEKEEEEDTKE